MGTTDRRVSPAPAVSPQLIAYARATEHLGELTGPVSGRATSVGDCGDAVGVELRVDGEDRIGAIKLQPRGCLYTLVCSTAAGALVQGRTIREALAVDDEDVARELGGLPEDHMHCARLALNALGEAISDHYARKRRGVPW